jgi:NADPH:quinone reductase-like Zn-dependent oxidoreductase
MRAAFITGYGDNSVVGYGEIADPTPGAGEALIEMRAAGTNPVEISMRKGTSGYASLPVSRRSWATTLRVWSPRHPRPAFKAGDEVCARPQPPGCLCRACRCSRWSPGPQTSISFL